MLASETPASFEVHCRGRAGTSLAMAELHDYRWAGPQRQIYADDRHCIDMVLSHRPPAARGRFIGNQRETHVIGRVLFLPGGHPMESEWAAGEQRSICCTIDPRIMDGDVNSSSDMLVGALDVRVPFVVQAMARLAEEASVPGFASDMVVEALCRTILIDLQRATPPERAASFSRVDLARVDDILAVDGPVPEISALAAEFGLSGRHFSRLFLAATGRSVAAYAAEQRAERAKALLAETRPQIKEIAWKCGFSSAAAFSAAFRKRTGMSPVEYRRTRRG